MTAARTLIAGLAILAAASLSGCAASASANGGSPQPASWELVSGTDAEGALPTGAGKATLTFGEDGVGGEVCNAYGGSFSGEVGTTAAGTISIAEVFSTQMWCEADGLMDLETRYLAALQTATEAQISGGFLHLNGDDVRLRFRQG